MTDPLLTLNEIRIQAATLDRDHASRELVRVGKLITALADHIEKLQPPKALKRPPATPPRKLQGT